MKQKCAFGLLVVGIAALCANVEAAVIYGINFNSSPPDGNVLTASITPYQGTSGFIHHAGFSGGSSVSLGEAASVENDNTSILLNTFPAQGTLDRQTGFSIDSFGATGVTDVELHYSIKHVGNPPNREVVYFWPIVAAGPQVAPGGDFSVQPAEADTWLHRVVPLPVGSSTPTEQILISFKVMAAFSGPTGYAGAASGTPAAYDSSIASGWAIDEVYVTAEFLAVPEPQYTAVASALALIGLALIRRCRV